MAFEENNDQYNKHLVELGDSKYEIVDGEPDITGWDVRDVQGQKIGEVDDLLFDPQSGSVRYIIVDLEDNEFGLDGDKKVLVPIGIAELHGDDDDNDTETAGNVNFSTNANADYRSEQDDNSEADEDETVVLPNVTAGQLGELPAYKKDELTPETESTIRRIFEGGVAGASIAGAASYERESFYNHDHFNENRFYGGNNTNKLPVIEENLEVGKQEVQTGGARITSRIVERPVQEDISLREEHVNIERTPVDRPISSSDVNAFKEEEFELTEHAEVPVVNKEARVVEEVSLNKEVQEREETIKDTLRNTEVEAERINTPKTDL
jgi:uncharacterized protein (TIGR02271 family)